MVERRLDLDLEGDTGPERTATAPFKHDPQTGLPIIICRPAEVSNELTPEKMKDILLDQEVAWQNKARRASRKVVSGNEY
jgi:hypothetical protein